MGCNYISVKRRHRIARTFWRWCLLCIRCLLRYRGSHWQVLASTAHCWSSWFQPFSLGFNLHFPVGWRCPVPAHGLGGPSPGPALSSRRPIFLTWVGWFQVIDLWEFFTCVRPEFFVALGSANTFSQPVLCLLTPLMVYLNKPNCLK